MPQSLAQIYLHIVYSTKHRKPFLKDEKILQDAHAYLAETCNNLDCPALLVGGVEDHVHLLCRLGRKITVADFIRDQKRASSSSLKLKPHLGDFEWQSGYGAFSISPAHVEPLTKYIETQKEHHQKESFQDEFRRLCQTYGVEIDERYVWD
jgi:REP element-mobilizing transposase RayT